MTSKFSRRRFVRHAMIVSAGATVANRYGTQSKPVFAAANLATNSSWGHLSGRFVFDGNAPKPKQIKVDKDEEACGNCGLIDESLLVDAKSNGLQNVVVYLYLKRGETIDSHPAYKETEKQDVILTNKCCRFEPHVVLLRTSQQLVAKAADPIASNVKIDSIYNPAINETIPSGTTRQFKDGFTREERVPIPISCPVHSWEKGWLVVRDNPYMAVSDFNGYFEILNLPVGEWTFQFWHEEAGYVDDVDLAGKPTTWRRGRGSFEIKPGQNDLGEIKVKPEAFEK